MSINWKLPKRTISFPRRPLIMGIVNINDDSFSGDGSLDQEELLTQCVQKINAGADIIDLGAESARTNREAISEEEELRRLLLVLTCWDEVLKQAKPRDAEQVFPPVVSINTWRTAVVTGICESPLGGVVELINDMGAVPEEGNAAVCAKYEKSLLIMHSVGAPKVAHFEQKWGDIVQAQREFFTEKLEKCQASGLQNDRIVLDPGLDFAKQRDDNLTLLKELEFLNQFQCPVLVPLSRKTFIGEVLDEPNAPKRDAGTVACLPVLQKLQASMVRVHNVDAVFTSLKLINFLNEA